MNTGTTKYAELCFSTVINDIDTLERNVRDYPASSLARFLLLYHYKKNGHPEFEKLANQTGVYLNNPYWIQYQLSQTDSLNETGNSNEDVENIATISNQPVVTDEVENNLDREENDDQNLTEEKEDEAAISAQPIEIDTAGDDAANEEPIAFEPLHTVDYFASQGIKITREELENDHFGKQVKSFTAWLKSMKKLHPGQVPEQNEVIEKIIQTSSEISNQNANVLTEAMAEVLVKQDKKEKAIEMYQKLSLINPSKSAYFVAKIERLKHI